MYRRGSQGTERLDNFSKYTEGFIPPVPTHVFRSSTFILVHWGLHPSTFILVHWGLHFSSPHPCLQVLHLHPSTLRAPSLHLHPSTLRALSLQSSPVSSGPDPYSQCILSIYTRNTLGTTNATGQILMCDLPPCISFLFLSVHLSSNDLLFSHLVPTAIRVFIPETASCLVSLNLVNLSFVLSPEFGFPKYRSSQPMLNLPGDPIF